MGWILGFGIPLTYFFGVAITFRIMYTRGMKEYLRWKNEDPTKVAYSFIERYGYETVKKTRAQLSYSWYCHTRGQGRKSGDPKKAWLWPYLITVEPMVKGIGSFCKPEIKVPDQIKIKKMELEDL